MFHAIKPFRALQLARPRLNTKQVRILVICHISAYHNHRHGRRLTRLQKKTVTKSHVSESLSSSDRWALRPFSGHNHVRKRTLIILPFCSSSSLSCGRPDCSVASHRLATRTVRAVKTSRSRSRSKSSQLICGG